MIQYKNTFLSTRGGIPLFCAARLFLLLANKKKRFLIGLACVLLLIIPKRELIDLKKGEWWCEKRALYFNCTTRAFSSAPLDAERPLGFVEVADAAVEAVVAAVDTLSAAADIVAVGVRVDVCVAPEPCSGAEAVLGLLKQAGVVDEIEPECLPARLVVGSARDLDGSASFEAHAVPGLCVAEVLASFVRLARGELLEPLQTAGLVPDLGEEVRDTQLGVDAGDLERLVEVRGVVGRGGSLDVREDRSDHRSSDFVPTSGGCGGARAALCGDVLCRNISAIIELSPAVGLGDNANCGAAVERLDLAVVRARTRAHVHRCSSLVIGARRLGAAALGAAAGGARRFEVLGRDVVAVVELSPVVRDLHDANRGALLERLLDGVVSAGAGAAVQVRCGLVVRACTECKCDEEYWEENSSHSNIFFCPLKFFQKFKRSLESTLRCIVRSFSVLFSLLCGHGVAIRDSIRFSKF